MAVWRCPHCATPQPEASRCWVCRRSTTCCATCRHFRRGVAGGLGVCGLDPRHPALTGTEMRACWVAAPLPVDPEGRPAAPGNGVVVTWVDDLVAPRPRTFVPVEPSGPTATAAAATAVAVAVEVAGTAAAGDPGPDPEAAPAAVAAEHPVPVAGAVTGPDPAPDPARPVPGRWWLWGDPEPWPES